MAIAVRLDYNCCKTPSCSNFGLSEQDDYLSPSYHLGYPALHCQACGSYPPLTDGLEVYRIYIRLADAYFSHLNINCPSCAPWLQLSHSPECSRYGFTSSAKQRLICKGCDSVFTPRGVAKLETLAPLLEHVQQGQSPQQSMQALGFSPKRYYFHLTQLKDLLSQYSRLAESQFRPKQLAVHSFAEVFELNSTRRLWCLFSQFSESGYVSMAASNLLPSQPPKALEYQPAQDNRLHSDATNLLEALKTRYQQTFARSHFEDLNYGSATALRGGELLAPREFSYAYFQLLAKNLPADSQLSLSLQHESLLRSAALMAWPESIRHQQQPSISYLLTGKGSLGERGSSIGWWQDRWLNHPQGAYCPIAGAPRQPAKPRYQQAYLDYLARSLLPRSRGTEAFLALWEIYRVLFNYCGNGSETSPAQRAGMLEQSLQPRQLLEHALQAQQDYLQQAAQGIEIEA